MGMRGQLRCDCSVAPGQQIVETGDLVVGDAGKDVGQPSLRVDAVEPGRLDERICAMQATSSIAPER
jgi:hypothetical protein